MKNNPIVKRWLRFKTFFFFDVFSLVLILALYSFNIIPDNVVELLLVVFKLFQFISIGIYGYFAYRISKKLPSLFIGLWKIIPIFGYIILWQSMRPLKEQAISILDEKSTGNAEEFDRG